MKKFTLFLSGLVLLTYLNAFAQMPYTVTASTSAYQPLTGATSINNSTIWDDDDFSVPLPFSFKLGGTTTSSFNLQLAPGGAGTTAMNPFTGISYGEMDLIDKGQQTGQASLSPIRYVVTGTAPNRIFKAEIANAGFFDELDNNNTTNDYVNIQVWLYETSNVVELHYGPSSISTTDYFFFGNGPAAGYLSNYDFDNGTADHVYTLAGNPMAPTIDSIDFVNMTIGGVLNSYPANGTVYRFTPKATTSIRNVAAFTGVSVYPTSTNSTLQVTMKDQQAADYQVIAADGRATGISGRASQGTQALDVSRLPQGVYLLQLTDAGHRSSYRFTKY